MRALHDQVLSLALLDRLQTSDELEVIEAARLLAPSLALDISDEVIQVLRSRVGMCAPGVGGPLIELLLELCPEDEASGRALVLDETLLEDYVSALVYEHRGLPDLLGSDAPVPLRDRSQREAVPDALARFAAVVGWPRVARAVFRSLRTEDAVALLARTQPLDWSEHDRGALGDHAAAVLRGARLAERTKLWLHLLAALTPAYRRALGASKLLACCRRWDTLILWLDDALAGLTYYVGRGVLTADEAEVLATLREQLGAFYAPDDALDALGDRVLRALCGDRDPLAVAHELPRS